MNCTSTQITAEALVKSLGREDVQLRIYGSSQAAADLRRERRSITQRIWMGSFPAAWYKAMREIADEKGVDCPMDLFSFKVPVGSGGMK